ncbi:hypothetical protein NQ176_g5419 [Zarea fungicola]|uniref:Uncharacterized protein n=1 Tax=Zarea fungicola TaxID=93591 RepID=A0ACC1NAH3_9HYPO|nr:hypothetical protein NQ176_g5419 [Lecanicillium fungicola]
MKRVAVVGAGPCGLAALKEMCQAGHKATLFERSGQLGGVFASAAAYPDLHLTISNWCMAFSDFPDPTRQCYPSASEYLEYLHDYAKHFDIVKHMQYNTEVLSAELQADNTWILQVQSNLSDDSKPRRLQFDALVVATGAHHEPNKDLPVLEGYRGQIIHSNQYDEAFKRHVAEKKPRVMGIGPALAIPKMLGRLDMSVDDVDVFEINEAFASMGMGMAGVVVSEH